MARSQKIESRERGREGVHACLPVSAKGAVIRASRPQSEVRQTS